MQQQQQYSGVPPTSSEMSPFCFSTGAAVPQEAASPISSRTPANCASVVGGGGGGGGFGEEDSLVGGAEEAERGVAPGNRWPRQETIALLKIRSDMDATFRDATLKGPLWEEVSRKLAELGYVRSPKKCKEKFENVHKYYKRTKDGRAARQDGKSYRFFSQLEAFHSTPSSAAAAAANSPSSFIPAAAATSAASPNLSQAPPSTMFPMDRLISPSPISYAAPAASAPPPAGNNGGAGRVSFSSNTSTSVSSGSDGEDTEDAVGVVNGSTSRKRKHAAGDEAEATTGGGGSRNTMAFFEGLMKQVMERQEAMQQRFLDALERRETDRTAREEAWRRQETARISREHEMVAQERSMAAARDAAVVAFLEKISGQSIELPTPPLRETKPKQPPPPSPPPPPTQAVQLPPPAPLQQIPPPPPQPMRQQQHQIMSTEIVVRQRSSASSSEIVPLPEMNHDGGVVATTTDVGFEPVSSSRWPKVEVLTLIRLRSGLEGRYQELGPKGPLWEEISSEMQRLGYNRSSKRCKEKWENINKYFKKVKESNKKRPEDSKTCPYFHELEAIYRKKLLLNGGGAGTGIGLLTQRPQQEAISASGSHESNPTVTAATPLQLRPPPPADGVINKAAGVGLANGEIFLHDGGNNNNNNNNKPESIMKEQQQHHRDQASTMEDYGSDNMDLEDGEEDDDDMVDDKMKYEIQFQRPNVGGNPPVAAATTPIGSFLGIVQ